MIYNDLGKTGLKVSALGMGITRFPASEYETLEGRERCAQVIVEAYKKGINYIDVAPTYCGWKAEEILGIALKQMGKDIVVVDKSSSTMDGTADALRRRLEHTLQVLGLDKLSLYNMWGILDYNQYLDVIKPGGPLEGAIKAKEEGLIEHIGFSTHCSGEEIERIIQDDIFEAVTLGYNAINFKFREQGLKAARDKGLGVAIMNPLNGGVIPRNPEVFSFIKNSNEMTLAQSALLFVASQDGVSTVLSGMMNEQEVEENTSIFDEKNVFPKEKVEQIKTIIVKDFDNLCTGCNYCAGCPKEIEINQLMLSYNEYVLSNKSIDELRRHLYEVWRYYPEELFNCIKCGRCEKKCTQHLNIINRISEVNGFANQYREEIIKPKLEVLFSEAHGKKVGVYASGPYAKRVFDLYIEIIGDIDFELFFFDSDRKKWNLESVVSGVKVYPPSEIGDRNIDIMYIASTAFYKPIFDSLKDYRDKGLIVKGIDI